MLPSIKVLICAKAADKSFGEVWVQESRVEYTFTLKYELSEQDNNLEELVERLYKENCGDAIVGVGHPGRIALRFVRAANSEEAAFRSAMSDVERAMPLSKLIKIEPDC